MSRQATDWAWAQNLERASTKLLLLALANRADSAHSCFPSIARMSADTGLNRKTVIDGLKRLQQMGLIHDTGQRRGTRGRVRVWRLNIESIDWGSSDTGSVKNGTKIGTSYGGNDPKTGTINGSDGAKSGTSSDPEIGISNGPENGTNNQSEETVRGNTTQVASDQSWTVTADSNPFIDRRVIMKLGGNGG